LVIPQTNKTLGKPVDLHEFNVWLGCVFFMSCLVDIKDCDLWWSTKAIDMFDGAPFCLNKYMTKVRFRKITELIRYTSKEAPLLFVDHEVPKMIDAFNDHYSSKYKPSWLSCSKDQQVDELVAQQVLSWVHVSPPQAPSFWPTEMVASQSCSKSNSSRGRIGQESRMERLPFH
jgi:hypothetical protein